MITKQSPYDEPTVAAAFDRLAVPHQFSEPARDLVAMLAPPVGSQVLDVGTGTGAVVGFAANAVGPDGLVVGIDAAIPMLRVCAGKKNCKPVAAQASQIPFVSGSFDAVTASFVLTHLEDPSGALSEMRRVTRDGGRLGVTTWGEAPNPIANLWKEVAATFVNPDDLQQAFRTVIPWDERFAATDNLRRAFVDAGLTAVEVLCRYFSVAVTTDDYLAMKGGTVEGTLLARMIGAERRKQFDERVAEAFRRRFGHALEFSRPVNFAIGAKPRTR